MDATLQLNGQLIVEDMNYMRVLVGRISVQAISQVFEQHGDRLLQRNIRRYLGLHSNRVNMAIHETLTSDKSDKFYFYNNGITVVCDKFDYNAFQKNDHQVQVKNMQVINGGQTCKTIHQTVKPDLSGTIGQSSYVMIRIYQMAEENKDFVQDITYATNSQNPVDLRDLRSNDEVQRQLEIGISDLNYRYKRQREDGVTGANVVTSLTVAEAVLAIWRQKPHHAKFRRKEHFGKLYEEIFQNLNAAQAVIATLIFRQVENERKHPSSKQPPEFLPYASHYIAMLIARQLLTESKIPVSELSHRNFADAKKLLDQNSATYHQNACNRITQALKECYGDRSVSLQQLSATFRRGDLLEMLKEDK